LGYPIITWGVQFRNHSDAPHSAVLDNVFDVVLGVDVGERIVRSFLALIKIFLGKSY
jgi:hypothetical protein